MIYRLLGDLEITGDGGRPLALPTGKALAVLAALLVNPDRLVTKAYLLRAAWGDSETQEAQLHKSINAVRRVLGLIGRRDHLITHQKSGYLLQVGEDLDMVVFRKLVRQAEEAAGSGRHDSEAGLLREALGLWRGPHPLSNVPEVLLRAEREAAGEPAEAGCGAAVRPGTGGPQLRRGAGRGDPAGRGLPRRSAAVRAADDRRVPQRPRGRRQRPLRAARPRAGGADRQPAGSGAAQPGLRDRGFRRGGRDPGGTGHCPAGRGRLGCRCRGPGGPARGAGRPPAAAAAAGRLHRPG